MSHHPGLARWHAAIAARDPAAIPGLLAEDCVFFSPILFRPQPGRALVASYLTAATFVLNNESFHYVGEWHAPGSAVLEFNTVVEDVQIDGIDMITWNDDGLISHFKVMVRPLRAINMLQQKMAAMLDQLKAG